VIRAVLDANVVASGTLRFEDAGTAPVEILRRWLASEFIMVTSDALRTEIEDTLLVKPYFSARVTRVVSDNWLATIDESAERTEITTEVSGAATHPKDHLILAIAVSGPAAYLVTGDRQLQRLGSFESVTIISPMVTLPALLDRELRVAQPRGVFCVHPITGDSQSHR